MADPERYQSALTGPEMDQALLDMANHTSERFAKGTANGVAVAAGTDGYNDNSKYYKDQAANQVQLAANQVSQATAQADRAANAADRAEAAVPVGTQSAVLFTKAQTLTTTQQSQARANIKAGGSNPNLLINGAFTSNQRDFSSTTGSNIVWTVDRWLLNQGGNQGGSVTLNSDGTLTLTAGTTTMSFQQDIIIPLLNQFVGDRMAASLLFEDGSIAAGTMPIVAQTDSLNVLLSMGLSGKGVLTVYYRPLSTGKNQILFQIQLYAGQTLTLKKCKLEYGNYSTIQNDKFIDPTTELLRGVPYFYRFKKIGNSTMPMASGYALSATEARFFIPLPATLRRVPTISVNGTFAAAQNGIKTLTNIRYLDYTVNGVDIRADIASGSSSLTASSPVALVCQSATGYIDFYAEL